MTKNHVSETLMKGQGGTYEEAVCSPELLSRLAGCPGWEEY